MKSLSCNRSSSPSRKENLERLDAVLARLEEAKESCLKTRDASNSSTKTDREPSATRRAGKELANYEEDPEQVIEHLREQYVELLQTEAEKSNERTAIESRIQALLQESSHRQEDLIKAQSILKLPREKGSTIGGVGSGTSDSQRSISRIPKSIGKSGAGQSCLPRGSNGYV